MARSSRMARTARLSTLFVALFATAALTAGPAVAAALPGHQARPGSVIDVFPGRHALAKALSKAQAGDTLNLHTGTYKDFITIIKPSITITSAGDGPVTVNGQCQSAATIAVQADNAVIEGITVVGGTFYEINFEHLGSGNAVQDTVTDTCGDAEYGVNVYDTQAVNVSQVTASGFGDSGIYIGSITRLGTQKLFIINNHSNGNTVGIIIEFSANQHIVVTGNDVSGNSTGGIALQTSSNIIVRYNTADDNGTYGIQADGGSNNNLIRRNTAMGNTFDLANLGQNNCFRHNHYVTSEGPIGC